MLEQKLDVISNYLKTNFKDDDHAGKYDFDKMSYLFRITTNNHILLASFSQEFIDDTALEEIASKLENLDVCKLLLENPKSKIVIRNNSAHIVPRD